MYKNVMVHMASVSQNNNEHDEQCELSFVQQSNSGKLVEWVSSGHIQEENLRTAEISTS